MLYDDGSLNYYRFRDAVDLDDLWAPAGGEVFFDDPERQSRESVAEVEERRGTVVSEGARKTLEHRNSYKLLKSSMCKRHTYHSQKYVLSVQIDGSTEMLVRCESKVDADKWLSAFNLVINKLLESSIKARTISGFKALGDYVSLKIDLNKSMSVDEGEGDSDEDEDGLVNVGKGLEDDGGEFVMVQEAPSASIPPPSLSILIMVVGTRGDVGPFVAMGKVRECDERTT